MSLELYCSNEIVWYRREEMLKKHLRKEAQKPVYGVVLRAWALATGLTLGKYLTSLYLSFLISKMGMIIVSLIELLGLNYE